MKFRTLAYLVGTLLVAAPALALEPPKVVVTYSLDCLDGGRYVRNITDTPLGLGNQQLIMCAADDESEGAVVLDVTPTFITVEYTADPNTQDIVDGPVELTDLFHTTVFNILALNGVITTVTDVDVDFERGVVGALSGNVITWDNTTPMRTASFGETDCFGNPTICSISAPVGGWPRVEDGTPTPHDLPSYSIFNNVERADAFSGDNLTPAEFTDDYIATMDAQATTIDTWMGVQVERQFVPEAAELLLLASSLGGLLGIRRLRAKS